MRRPISSSHCLTLIMFVCALTLGTVTGIRLKADDTPQEKTVTVKTITVKVDASDLVKKIMKDRGYSKRQDARSALVREITVRAQLPITIDKNKKSWFQWNDDQLVVNQTKPIQEKVKNAIEQIRKHGFGTTMIEFRFLELTEKTRTLLEKSIEKNRLNARKQARVPAEPKDVATVKGTVKGTVKSKTPKLLPKNQPFPRDLRNAKPNRSDVRPASLESPIKNSPMIYGVVQDEQIRELFKQIKAEKKSRIIMAPKMIGLNGQKMSCFVGQEVPFVEQDKEGKPVVRFLKDGLTTTVITMQGAEKELVLDLIFENSEVVSDGKKRKAKKRLPNIPQVNKTMIQSVARIQSGQSLVMSGPKELGKNKDMSVIVLVTPRPIEKGQEEKK